MITVIKLELRDGETANRCARRTADDFFTANYSQTIIRLPSGRPTIGGHEISISHTASFLAIMVCDSRCGVDIELVNRDITRLTPKFASPAELELLHRVHCGNQCGALLIWCAKEAMYKFLDRFGVDFLRDLRILDIDCNKINATGCGMAIDLEWRINTDNLMIVNTLPTRNY